MTMHFDGLFDCSKGNFNRHCRELLGHESFYIVFKRKENRIDVKEGGGGGRGSALNVILPLRVIRSIFRRPLILSHFAYSPRWRVKTLKMPIKIPLARALRQHLTDHNRAESTLSFCVKGDWRVDHVVQTNRHVIFQVWTGFSQVFKCTLRWVY